MLTNFKDEDFDTKIKNEDVSVIQFSAEWCGPCKALKPVMDKLSDEFKDKAGFIMLMLKMVELTQVQLLVLEVFQQLSFIKKVLK